MNENETVMLDEKEVYEISFIFDGRLEEGKAVEKLEALKKDIASLEGSFISEETPYMRELSYEMVRVVNNVNVKFAQGYFGWVKFELLPKDLEEINKKLKLDEEVIRFLIVKTTKGNDIFTKDIPVMKADPVFSVSPKEEVESEEGNVDTTVEDNIEENLDEEKKEELEAELEDLETSSPEVEE
ncbi:30S ribosomal protein S6 [bioreactor metagenome]|uniref:30S ribosomal protein S6 n=1 Tax=bioreactor metagenome TaxID=1076179 RepID=A0A644UA09_9ZZZZ|nr:30S ribosomal protein S6 [Candidatus Elulimicrobiales bacterium]